MPAALLDGTTLTVPDQNLYLEAPGPEWTWLAATEPRGEGPNRYQAYSCQLDSSRQFLVGVFDPYWDPPTPDSRARFVAGVSAGFEKAGWATTASEPEPARIPLRGSYRFQITGENAESARVYVYGYVGVRGRMFTFQHVSAMDAEPPEFTEFVSSFQFVGEPPGSATLEDLSSAHLALAVALTVLVGVVGWLVNAVAGRIVVNRWTIALVLLLVAGTGLAVFWMPRISEAVSPERAGYLLGYSIVAPIALPAVFALWRSRALSRKKSEEPA